MEGTEREFGQLDYLVNNAGWSTRVPHKNLDALTDEIWDRTLDVNWLHFSPAEGEWRLLKSPVSGSGGAKWNETGTSFNEMGRTP